ncbi:SIMPL domain-containing protein [Zobellella taiwanensis]|uniref:SIMPL domain-containing protein n=1 Tax=Zobellella taiwanensis TaxID=347535 RepID=A0A2P7QL96_9GAMM|nr:SIMPL domain-containing protein [Zobellella taiwanensis]PSJ38724.1 hypothetical protein C7I36_13840 [Zobellella taiwanensis]
MHGNDRSAAALLGGLIALGLVWGGSHLRDAVQLWKQADRVVAVKGLAERQVQADLVLWPISFSVTADSLAGLYDAIDEDRGKITRFLGNAGFEPGELSIAAPVVQDVWASQFAEPRPPQRYRADAVVLVRSNRVDLVKQSLPASAELVSQGVLLTQSYEHKIQYVFTGLNDIKPAMIAEATANAREAARQFAKDADAEVGGIRSAQQGYFSVTDLDSYTPEIKQVRVVTSVDYLLE